MDIKTATAVQIAETMGTEASTAEGAQMRELLLDAGFKTTEEVPAAEWERLLAVACAHVTIGQWTGPMETAVALMDDGLQEALHAQGFPTEQEFLDAYAAAHARKFGEQFAVA
jgi:hypothetical protein